MPDEGRTGTNGATRPKPVFIIAMGICGTGKSTLGTGLAAALQMPFVDGDDLHPASNISKMAAGQPLTDADRLPWLSAIRETAQRNIDDLVASGPSGRPDQVIGLVAACSALKRSYRDVLRGLATDATNQTKFTTYFVFIDGTRDAVLERMEKRQGHFMKAGMVDSQLETLENPQNEQGVVIVDLEDSREQQVQSALKGLENLFGSDR